MARNFVTLWSDNGGRQAYERASPTIMGLHHLGQRQERFYAPTAECCPSRAAFLTGLYANNSLVFKNGDPIDGGGAGLTEADDTLFAWLDDAGVNCAMFGKPWDYTVSSHVQPGVDYLRIVQSSWHEAMAFSIWDGTSQTPVGNQNVAHWLRENVVDWITNTAVSPFCLWVAAPYPHPALADKTTAVGPPFPTKPSGKHGGRYWTARPTFETLLDTTDHPSWIASRDLPSESQKSQMVSVFREQCRSNRDFDDLVSDVIDALVTEGFMDDTILSVTTDNAISETGAHRIGYPATATDEYYAINNSAIYDIVEKIPGVIVGTEFPAGRPQRAPTMLQDLTATAVDLFNVTPSQTLDGQSLLSSVAYDRGILLSIRDSGVSPDCDGIAKATRKLHRYGEGTTDPDKYEMFDVDTDPLEEINVAYDSSRLSERNALETELDALIP